jgi:hypothetical protein
MPLFASVRLVQPLRAEGEALPAGSSGTIVEVLSEGEAYIVEFFRPRHCVATVCGRSLTLEN